MQPPAPTKPAFTVVAVACCLGACGRIGYDTQGEGSGGLPTGSAAGAAGMGTSGAGGRIGVGGARGAGAAGGSGGGATGGAAGSADGGGDASTSPPVAGRMYQLIGQSSGKCLDIPLSSKSDGAPIDVLTCTGGSNQLFFANPVAGGSYTFANVNSGKCLDVGDTMRSTQLSQVTCNGSLLQTFALSSPMSTFTMLVNGASGFCIDVDGDVRVDGTGVGQFTCMGSGFELWTFTPIATGGCTPESDAAFCTRLGATCDGIGGTDNCGSRRTVTNCGLCPSLQQACGVTAANACGAIGKTSLAQGGTVTASDPGSSGTLTAQAFDGLATTKWRVGASPTPWVAYQFAGATKNVVTSYSLTSGDDWSDRDPSAWLLEGSNDGNSWTRLDTRTGQRFANREQTNYYSFANTTAYNRYRWTVTANNGSPDFQIAEIQLFP